jgi:hypothetical protein
MKAVQTREAFCQLTLNCPFIPEEWIAPKEPFMDEEGGGIKE